MARDPVPRDIMTMLITLAHRADKNADLRRIRFEATFSACNGQIDDHPAIALTWLWKLHQGMTKTRQASIRKSCRNAFMTASRQNPEQAMILATYLMNDSPSGGKLQECAAAAFMKAFERILKGDPRTDRDAAFTFKALRQVDDPELGRMLKSLVVRRLAVVRHGIKLPENDLVPDRS